MSRLTVLSIVLTLIAGQNAALVCRVRCVPMRSPACQHQDSSKSASVSANDNCDRLALSGAIFLRENVRRTVSAPDGQHALVVSCFQFADPITKTHFGFEPALQRAPAERTFVLHLRI